MNLRHRSNRPALAIGALLLALPLSACSQDDGVVDTDDAVEDTDDKASEPEAGLDVESLSFEEVSDDLSSRAGEEITVTAEVEDVVTDQVFTINSLDGNDLEPIVVTNVDGDQVVDAGTPVRVTGLVAETFILTDVEETVGVQLDDELLADFENRPYLEATHVDTDIDQEAVNEARKD